MEFNKNHLTVYSNLPQADYEGWLSKQESTKFLKKWFSLKGNILFYFQKSSDKEPLGIIILEGCSIATGLSFDCASYEIGGHIIKVDRFGNVNRATPFEDIERKELNNRESNNTEC
uniref:PH domain-containing protein n=1 Tax=Clastoptera arizonana TaxID=38151 RepID=A0A1B6DCR3_9HEMI